jgi:hypothetical protein
MPGVSLSASFLAAPNRAPLPTRTHLLLLRPHDHLALEEATRHLPLALAAEHLADKQLHDLEVALARRVGALARGARGGAVPAWGRLRDREHKLVRQGGQPVLGELVGEPERRVRGAQLERGEEERRHELRGQQRLPVRLGAQVADVLEHHGGRGRGEQVGHGLERLGWVRVEARVGRDGELERLGHPLLGGRRLAARARGQVVPWLGVAGELAREGEELFEARLCLGVVAPHKGLHGRVVQHLVGVGLGLAAQAAAGGCGRHVAQ